MTALFRMPSVLRTPLVVCMLAVLPPAAAGAAQARQAEPVEVRCPSVLGVGLATQVPFCDVEVHSDPALGVLVMLPHRRGEATLSFNLHNRHAYSEQAAGGRAYAQYVASIAVATMEGEVLARGVVLSEFRSAADLVDRIGGGAGPLGLKAVAPTGSERVFVTLPPGLDQVSIVGRSMEVLHADGRDTFRAAGRPIAVLSEAVISYRPR